MSSQISREEYDRTFNLDPESTARQASHFLQLFHGLAVKMTDKAERLRYMDAGAWSWVLLRATGLVKRIGLDAKSEDDKLVFDGIKVMAEQRWREAEDPGVLALEAIVVLREEYAKIMASKGFNVDQDMIKQVLSDLPQKRADEERAAARGISAKIYMANGDIYKKD